MKVLMQEWHIPGKGQLTSISKDRAQLDATIGKIAAKKSEDEDDYEEVPEVRDEPMEIEIPDDSVFAEMVEADTIFLNGDEMDLIYDAVNGENEDRS